MAILLPIYATILCPYTHQRPYLMMLTAPDQYCISKYFHNHRTTDTVLTVSRREGDKHSTIKVIITFIYRISLHIVCISVSKSKHRSVHMLSYRSSRWYLANQTWYELLQGALSTICGMHISKLTCRHIWINNVLSWIVRNSSGPIRRDQYQHCLVNGVSEETS